MSILFPQSMFSLLSSPGEASEQITAEGRGSTVWSGDQDYTRLSGLVSYSVSNAMMEPVSEDALCP